MLKNYMNAYYINAYVYSYCCRVSICINLLKYTCKFKGFNFMAQ